MPTPNQRTYKKGVQEWPGSTGKFILRVTSRDKIDKKKRDIRDEFSAAVLRCKELTTQHDSAVFLITLLGIFALLSNEDRWRTTSGNIF